MAHSIKYETTKSGLIGQVNELVMALMVIEHFLETGYIENNEHDVKLALDKTRQALAQVRA